jgi:hypothetical protein
MDVRGQLEAYAEALSAAYAAHERGAAVLAGNWWRAGVDGPLSGEIGEREARLIAARDHGFDAWSSVGGCCDKRFELAVEAVVEGRTADLTELLGTDPVLATRRSIYGHGATLLHYTAANGVEIRRQVVPENAAAVAATLIAAGADPAARLLAYAASFDVLELLRTSSHPRSAGVADDEAMASFRGPQPPCGRLTLFRTAALFWHHARGRWVAPTEQRCEDARLGQFGSYVVQGETRPAW